MRDGRFNRTDLRGSIQRGPMRRGRVPDCSHNVYCDRNSSHKVHCDRNSRHNVYCDRNSSHNVYCDWNSGGLMRGIRSEEADPREPIREGLSERADPGELMQGG